jgi:hypothetical protein
MRCDEIIFSVDNVTFDNISGSYHFLALVFQVLHRKQNILLAIISYQNSETAPEATLLCSIDNSQPKTSVFNLDKPHPQYQTLPKKMSSAIEGCN